ncbi:meiotic cell cortex C-terminal pleckstrin homology-domain-containing protein [Zopfochytrium polystomum]|nr:meiotic cell cortex C-terminal pleckstrin homology-domain-containing protein [Zopfochytrium polystomum]
MGMRRGSAEDESHLRRYEQRLRLMENMQAEWMDRKRALETEVVTLSRQKEKHASNEARLNRQLWNMELQNQQLLERNALLELESDRIRSQMRALDGKHLALQEEIERLRNSTVTSKEDADAWERRVRELEVEVSRRGLLAGRLLAERELHTRQMSELEEENGRMFRRPDAELGDSAKEEQDGASAERVFGMDVVPSDSDSHSSRPVNAPKYPDRRGSVLSPPANASPSGPDWNLVDSMADALQQSQGQMEALKGENDVLRKSLAEVLALLDATRDMMDSMRGESSLFVQQPPPPETLADLRTRTPSPIIDPPKIAFVPAVTEQPQPAETAKSTPTGSSPVSHAVSDDERDDDDNTPLNQLVRVGSLRSSSQQVSEATLRGVAMSEAMMSELNLLISDPIDLDMSISRTSAPVLCGSPVLPLPQVPPKSRSVQQSMNTLSSSIPRKIVLSRPAFYRPLQNIKSYSSQSVPAVAARLYALGSGRSSTMADSPRTSFDAGSSKGSDGDHVYQNAAAVDALTETMVGAWFQKYNRHRRFPKLRFFWVNPYGRVLNWAPNSTTKRKEGVARTAVIEGVVAAPTPMAEHHKNFPPNEQHAITIITRRRAIVIVPTNWTDHATWILGLNLLVSENGMQPLHERFKFVDVRRSLDRERPPAAASSAQQEERGRTAVTRTTTNNPKVDAGGSSASSSYEDAITPIGSSLSTPQRTQSPSPAPSVSFASADEPPSTTALAPPYVKPQSRLQRRISGIFSRSSSKPALSAAASLDTISAGSETEEISYVRRALGRNSPQPGRKGSLKDSWRRSIDLRGSERKHLRVSTLPSSAAREDGNDGGGGGSPK